MTAISAFLIGIGLGALVGVDPGLASTAVVAYDTRNKDVGAKQTACVLGKRREDRIGEVGL